MPTQLSNNISTTISTTYLDDFSESKRYYKILFRPSTAVQARELNQIQSILQNQISRLGDYSFKDGSIVDGVAPNPLTKLPFIRLNDTFTTNTSQVVTVYDNDYLITNSANGTIAVKAYISYSKRGYKANYPDTNRWYLNYVQTGKDGSNNDINEFQSGDTLYVYNTTQTKSAALNAGYLLDTITAITTNATVNATGYGYGMSVGSGIIYQKGFFLTVNSQVIVVRDYDSNVNNYVVGFETTESITTENQDSSLYDNAIGSPNYNAPGAHRLKLTPTLVAKLRTEVSNNFFAIAEFENANTITQKAGTDPTAKLLDSMAQRTYDESGDYVVRPFFVDSEADTANSSAFYYRLSPGLAYVKGYPVEKISDVFVNSPRAVNTNIENNIGVTCNMGNYVVVDEVEGVFNNETLSQVTLYDTAQNSLSDIELASTGPSGSVVGYANIRGMQHFDGTKGFYNTQYALYIFNIRMSSGKSFATDVKSFYQTTAGSGYAKADAVLESNVAILKDSTFAASVFPTGFGAVKTLVVNGAASTDSSFTFRQISSTTMASNGSAIFSLDTAATGGTERLGISVGNYTSSSILNKFNIVTGAAAYSSNIAGSVSITSGSVNVTGTSTSFTTAIANGELLRVANSTATVYYQVNKTTNNTFMNLVSIPGATYATYNVAHYYPEGHHFNITSINAIAGGISFNINTGLTLNSSLTVYGSYPVTKSTAVQVKKDVNEGTFVKIDCSNNAATSVGPWDLGLTDVFNIKKIYVGTTYANTNTDGKDWFSIDNGQRDDLYDHAQISLKPQYLGKITGSSKMLIELDHFVANTSAGVGFFTVDSYPIDDANTSNTTAITTAQIPTFQSNKGYVDLRNAIDFRPVKYNTATVTTTIGSATVNPVASNTSFNITSTNQYIAEPDSTFTGDFEYYLPRYDIVTMDVAGKIIAKNGQSAVIPKVPYIENDVMPIAEVFVPPYPSLTVKEAETYKRKDLSMRISVKTTKRYTMKDLTKFDDRIKRLEYYVVLNALEQQAKDMNIPSASNPALNRFKNGIFADPFNSFNSADVTNIEFKASIDAEATVLRPFYNAYPVDFKYDSGNSTTVATGSTITSPFTHVQYIRQPYATKYRNCTESVWQWNGKVELFPSYDFFRDEKQANNINVNIDNSAPWKDFANSPFGTNYGDWRTTGSSSSTTRDVTRNDNSTTTTATTITQTTQQRTVLAIKVDTVNEKVELGNYVSDFSINPYLRSRIVAFTATNLKPNTTMHVFFDGKSVDAYCAPGTLNAGTTFSQGKENEIVTQSAAYGTALVSSSDGKLYGLFKIPEGLFRTGDRVLRIVNVSDLVTGADAIITSATGTYSGSSMSVTKQGTTLNLTQPQISSSSNTQVQTLTSVSVQSSTRQDRQENSDPIAQTFKITRPEDGSSGVYVTKVGVYFYAKDNNANNGITVYITETDNGYPNGGAIIGQGRILSANVTTSTTGTVETQVSLDEPIMLTADKEYAFIVKPDGNSPEWLIWTAETGGVDVNTSENVFSNPYSGVLFVSANMSAWTAIQKEDIKFNIYRASFSVGTYYAYFDNENDEYITTAGFTRANSSLSIEVGDLVYSANSTGGPNTAANAAFGRVQYADEANGVLYLDGSTNGKFFAANNINVYRTPNPSNTAYITNTYLIANATISTVDNLMYHAVVPKFATIQPILTDISYDFKGTDGSYAKDTSYQKLVGETEFEYLDKSRYAVSKSNEVASMSSAKSSTFRIALNTSTSYASPAIGLGRKSSIFVKNIINNDATNEYTRYGNATTKYVSKKIVLADGQEAEDLKVSITAYRPVDTDFYVYGKFWNPSDPETFDIKNWTLLSYLNDGDLVYSSPTDRTNFYEYEFGVPAAIVNTNDAYLDATNSSILSYVNAAGSKFSSFKVFSMKIVLLSSNAVRIPMINDIRAIALQV